MFYGILDLSLMGYVIATLLMTHVTIVSVTVFLHRHQAHRALDLHPALSHFFRFWLWLTTGMVTRAWTAVHRKHHAKCEGPEDPHSPKVFGIRKVLLQGAELYRREADNPETLEKYGHGTPDDWLERNVYSRHSIAGLGLLLVIDVLLFGVPGITVWAVQMMWIPFWAAGVINGLGHYWGYRNYETPDVSTNVSPWGILIGGEELHNNHHAFSSSAKFSVKRWEIDVGWMYIRLFEWLGLVRVKKLAPKPVIEATRQKVDVETVRAIIANRFHVLSQYANFVIQPMVRDALANAGGRESRGRFARHVGKLLAREQSLMDDSARNRLDDVLRRYQALRTVYDCKVELQNLWKRSAQSQEGVLLALQEWCRKAEDTGNCYIQNFARYLQCYRLQAVVPVKP